MKRVGLYVRASTAKKTRRTALITANSTSSSLPPANSLISLHTFATQTPSILVTATGQLSSSLLCAFGEQPGGSK